MKFMVAKRSHVDSRKPYRGRSTLQGGDDAWGMIFRSLSSDFPTDRIPKTDILRSNFRAPDRVHSQQIHHKPTPLPGINRNEIPAESQGLDKSPDIWNSSWRKG